MRTRWRRWSLDARRKESQRGGNTGEVTPVGLGRWNYVVQSRLCLLTSLVPPWLADGACYSDAGRKTGHIPSKRQAAGGE